MKEKRLLQEPKHITQTFPEELRLNTCSHRLGKKEGPVENWFTVLLVYAVMVSEVLMPPPPHMERY